MAQQGRSAKYKGSAYERKIAKLMSEGFHTDVQRTAYSGASRGIDTQYNNSEVKGENGFVGDLFFPQTHPMSIFNYELKNHAGVKLIHFFNSNGEIPSFVEQVVTDSNRLGGVNHSVPCLIIHVNREDDYVVIPFEPVTYESLTKIGSTMITLLSYKQERTGNTYRYQVIVTNLTNFMTLDPTTTYHQYHHLDWNRLNHNLATPKDKSVDEILGDL